MFYIYLSYSFIEVNLSHNYISFELVNVDDCVRLINISNQIFFNFTPLYNAKICGNYDAENLGHCDAGKYDMYEGERYHQFLLKNYE